MLTAADQEDTTEPPLKESQRSQPSLLSMDNGNDFFDDLFDMSSFQDGTTVILDGVEQGAMQFFQEHAPVAQNSGFPMIL